MEIVGTQGIINLDLMSQGIAICDRQGYRLPDFGHGIEQELSHFLRCVRDEDAPGISGQEARAALELSLAAQKSAQSGYPIAFPMRESV